MEQQSQEIYNLQQKIDSLQNELSMFQRQKRELETLNDNFEMETRVLEFSKQDLEQKLYQAEEEAILYKEELDAIRIAKEEEVARLKDEMRDLEDELSYVKRSEDKQSQQRAQQLSRDIKKLNNEKEKIRNSILLSPEDIDSIVKQVTSSRRADTVAERPKYMSQ